MCVCMCVGERLQRGDRSRRLPSAHETAAVVDRPTNNGLISPVLLVFPFLPPLTRHTRVRLLYFILFFLSLSSASTFLLPLSLFLSFLFCSTSSFGHAPPFLERKLNARQGANRRRRVVSPTRARKRRPIYIYIYIYYILATKQIPATTTFLPV